jgi:hypothetical protein
MACSCAGGYVCAHHTSPCSTPLAVLILPIPTQVCYVDCTLDVNNTLVLSHELLPHLVRALLSPV